MIRVYAMQRGQFSSRLAFIFAASGSAVGLGNIWGFPTNAAENGGAAFVLMYFILAFLLAYPAMMAELIIGRHTRSNMVTALQTISTSRPAKTIGRLVGVGGMVTAGLILSFYSIIIKDIFQSFFSTHTFFIKLINSFFRTFSLIY